MVEEFYQLDKGVILEEPVVVPIDAKTLTETFKGEALEAVDLIKEKIYGSIKERTCSDGNEQRKYFKEGQSVVSPIFLLASLLITSVMDNYEGQYVATFHVP